jgi:hypothetical protein
VTRADGAQLRERILSHWNDDEPLVLDFDGVRIASVSFFDESLGLLAKEYALPELTAHVRVENIDPADRKLLNSITLARSRERRLTSDSHPVASRSSRPRSASKP